MTAEPGRPVGPLRLVATRRRFLLAAAAIVAFAVAVDLTRVIPSDLGFLLYAAGRVLDGARLYVDLIEINPPLIIALNVPIVLAARAAGLPEILVYRLATTALLLVCLALTGRILRHVLPAGASERRRWLLLLLTLALFLVPGVDFGEREHLMLALIAPYLVLTSARAAGLAVPGWEAAGVGALAGLGFALKPHFLLLPAALEVYLFARRRSRHAFLRPETVAAAAFLLVYGATVLLVTPEYIRMVRLLGGSYVRFLYHPFLQLLVTGPGVILSYFSILTWVALFRYARFPALGEVTVVAVLGALVAGAAQQKGLSYHFYPSFALALVLLGILIVDSWGTVARATQRLYHVLAGAVLATAFVGVAVEAGLQLGRRGPSGGLSELVPLSRLVSEKAAGQPIFVMSHNIGSAFPLINYSGAVLGSRFHHLWILAADYLDRMKAPEPLSYREPGEMPPSERFLNQAVLADFERYRPRLLVVMRHARDDPANGYRRFDYIRYFARDPRFAKILGEYQELDRIGNYVVYERVLASRGRVRPPPTPVPGTQDVVPHRADVLGLGIGGPMFLLRLGVFTLAVLVFTAVQLAVYPRPQGDGPPGTGGM